MFKQTVKKDVGGTLEFYPPEGVASAATITIKKSDNSNLTTAVSGVSATIDSVSTTLSANADEGDTQVSVTSATGITAKRKYLVTASDGRVQEVTVMAISGTTISLLEPLNFAFVSTNTFNGYRLSYSLTAGNSDDNYKKLRATWSYTVSVSYSYTQRIDVAENPFKSTLSFQRLSVFRPDIADRIGGFQKNWELIRDYSLDLKFIPDIEQNGKDENLIMFEEQTHTIQALAVLFVLMMGWGNDWVEERERIDKLYNDRLRAFLDSPYWYDEEENLSMTDEEGSKNYTSMEVIR